MIIVLGQLTVRPDCVADALAASQAHVARSRLEPGCIAHAVHRDTEHPSRFVFVEKWETAESLWIHRRMQGTRDFVSAVVPMSSEKGRIEVYESTEVAVPPRD